MLIIERFKSYLLSTSNHSSKATAKNYVADIRKFINWFEANYDNQFSPSKVTIETIGLYKAYLTRIGVSKASSLRYASSLKIFFVFLKKEAIISKNPFSDEIKIKKNLDDPLLIDNFRKYLLEKKLTRISIKNYLVDIRQFTDWLFIVMPQREKGKNKIEIFRDLDPFVVEEYKNRLLNQSKLSANSVNRKLSSIRKYVGWLGGKELVIARVIGNKKDQPLTTTEAEVKNYNATQGYNSQKILENGNSKVDENDPILEKPKASFVSKIIDSMLVIPSLNIIRGIQYAIWLIKGKKIFEPTLQKLETIYPKADNLNISNYIRKNKIHNISKFAYAPLSTSIDRLPKFKKLIFHIRYSRPNWYKLYHSYPISDYFHIGILIIFTSLFGSMIYFSINGNYKQSSPAFASPGSPPPKKLFFQGKLTDAKNNPITSQTPLRFIIYNNKMASGSALLWQEVQNIQPNKEGEFSAQVGASSAMPGSIFYENPNLYLGMTIADNPELKPRQQLATVGYSGNAQKLQGLLPITQSEAGTSNVILALDSAGNLTIGGKASPVFQATEGQFTLSGNTLLLNSTEGSNSNIVISPDGNGFIDLQKPLQNTTNNNNIETALGAVEVDDIFAILATSSAQSALTISQNGNGPIISASSEGIAKFTLSNDGSGSFYGNLGVNGNNISSSNTSFSLLNNNVINLSLASSATSITIGAPSGTTRINNTLIAGGGLTVGPNRSLIVSGNVASSLIPFTTAKYDLGSSQFHWNNAYIDNLYTSNNASVSGFWQRNNGIIASFNPNDDVIIGGSSSANAKIRLFGSGDFNGTASLSGGLTFTNDAAVKLLNGSELGFYRTNFGDSSIDTANPSLFIGSNNNIGIGTNLPTTRLDINGDARADNLRVSADGAMIFEDSNSNKIAQIKQVDLGSNGADLSFYTKDAGGSLTEKMRLEADGSLIIGGTNAQATLDVRGNSNNLAVESISGNTKNAALTVDNSGTGDIFAASSSGATRFVISQNGNVGIGDSNPGNSLKVVGSLCVKDSAGPCSGNTTGTIYATNTTLQSADVAENYVSSEDLEPGDLVMPEGKENNAAVIKTQAAYQKEAIGVVSTKPGITLNSDATVDSNYKKLLPIALTGRVPVKVSSENGPIHTGDYITASSIPGVGMKPEKAGVVIGKALEGYDNPDPSGVGKIMVFINLSYYDPINSTGQNIAYNSGDNNQGFLAIGNVFGQAENDDLKNLLIQAKENFASSLQIAGENIMIGGQTLGDYITGLIKNIVEQQLKKEIAGIKNSQDKIDIVSPISSVSGQIKDEISTSPAITPTSEPTPTSASISATFVTNVTNVFNINKASDSAGINLNQDQNATNSALNDNNISNSSSSGVLSASREAEMDTDPARGIASSSAVGSSGGQNAGLDNKTVVELMGMNSGLDFGLENLSSISALVHNGDLNKDAGIFEKGLMVFGQTTLSDTAIAGNLNVGGSLILADNSINTLGSDLEIQPLRQGNLSIMGGLVRIDTNGNLSVGGNANFAKDVNIKGRLAVNIIAPVPDSDLVIKLGGGSENRTIGDNQLVIRDASESAIVAINQKGDVTASGTGSFGKIAANALNIVHGAQADTSLIETVASASAGTAVITAYETERTVISPFMNNDSLIYLTATSDTQGLTPFVARQKENSFTIAIPYSINKEIKVNWWIVN